MSAKKTSVASVEVEKKTITRKTPAATGDLPLKDLIIYITGGIFKAKCGLITAITKAERDIDPPMTDFMRGQHDKVIYALYEMFNVCEEKCTIKVYPVDDFTAAWRLLMKQEYFYLEKMDIYRRDKMFSTTGFYTANGSATDINKILTFCLRSKAINYHTDFTNMTFSDDIREIIGSERGSALSTSNYETKFDEATAERVPVYVPSESEKKPEKEKKAKAPRKKTATDDAEQVAKPKRVYQRKTKAQPTEETPEKPAKQSKKGTLKVPVLPVLEDDSDIEVVRNDLDGY